MKRRNDRRARDRVAVVRSGADLRSRLTTAINSYSNPARCGVLFLLSRRSPRRRHMRSCAPLVLLCALAVLLAGCAAAPVPTVPAPAPAPAKPRDAATAAAIGLVLAGEHRSAENRARDAWRHPLDT